MNKVINKIFRYSFSTSNSLYTWGETTYGWGRPTTSQLLTPGLVEGFQNINNVATGPYHLLFSSANGDVYSTGLGDDGRLGLGNKNSVDTPEQISGLRGLAIKQLAAGYKHSLALTQSGDVYSWGYGGSNNIFSQMKNRAGSPLGHSGCNTCLEPKIVENLPGPVSQITAGYNFSLALSEEGKIYGWGSHLPLLSEVPSIQASELSEINFFLERNHGRVLKMRAGEKSAFFLLDNGRIYVVGENSAGFFATRQNPLVIEDNVLISLTKIIDEDYSDQRIEDFDISANSLIFRTDSGSIFYSGMHSKFRPTHFPVKAAVKKIFATYDSVGVVTEDNRILFVNDQFIDDADREGDIIVSDDENLKRGVQEIGGNYRLRYALVQN